MSAEAAALDPRDHLSTEPDLHSATDAYAARFAGPVGAWMLETQAEAVLEMLAPWPKARVLDIGGGHAQLIEPIAASGREITVLASSEEALGRAAAIAETHPNASTAVGDLMRPPFEPQSFDVVVSVRMLAHIADWRAFLGVMAGLARQAVVVDYAPTGGANLLQPLLFGLKKRLEGNTRPFVTMTRREVADAAAAHGFELDAAAGQFVAPMVVHRKLKRPSASRAIEGGLRRIGLSGLGAPVIARAVRKG